VCDVHVCERERERERERELKKIDWKEKSIVVWLVFHNVLWDLNGVFANTTSILSERMCLYHYPGVP
jgi:hypothetical protein